MNRLFVLIVVAFSTIMCNAESKVYLTKDITPEGLVKVYEALGVKPVGKVAVKISTGEMGGNNYLKPALIEKLVKKVDGTIVECCTAYGGSRQDKAKHWETIKAHGFLDIAKVDIMDEFGEIKIPVRDTTWLKYDIVGENVKNYDFMINLAHYKGHQMGGFGGVLKNASIGVASTAGKAYIHSHGITEKTPECWSHTQPQDAFLESMAAAAQAVHDYFVAKSTNGETRIIYIAVMNNMSIDCDCDSHPAEPLIADYGILASLDPVALDQACYDIVTKIHNDEHNNTKPLLDRIAKLHGTHILEWSEKIGLGSTKYEITELK